IVAAGRRKRIGASRMLALGALSAAALLSSRNIDFLALAAVAWVSPLLGRIRPVLPAVMLSAAAALPFIVGVPREFGPPREPGLGVDWSIYPRELTSFLEENPELLSARIFNTNEISGYLEYRLGERLPLYMDGRCHLYTERFYAGYLLLAYARPEDAPAVMGILDSGGIDLALFNWPGPGESSAYILSASPAWLPVYWDSITIVYGRKTFLDETGFLSRSFEVVDPLAPQTLLQVLYYQMPDSWRDELVMAASPPMNYQPAMIPATALMLCTDSLFDSPGFVFGSEGMRSSLDSVLSGSDPGIEDPRLRVLQAWVLARAGRYDDAVQAAERSGDLTLRSSLAVLTENGMRSSVQGASCPPPLMVPPAAWAEYMNGEASMGDSAVIGAAAMFVSGMRTGSLDSVRAILDAGTELSPWGYSVSGSIAVLCGLDSMAVALGATALMMNRNPYTLLMLGNIESVSGNGDRAIELFSESLQLSDGFLEARLQRAEQLWRTGALEEALADYRLLKELNYLTPAAEFHLMWGEHFAASPPAAGE
ncbi:MAG: tetratricopeptide repeat protein, partial [Candidatus Fermentibacteraceae bacterium]|nr:tetratricopeptide repeat protein [Candidatus Fermentibacteraceae bacterium]